jgi:ferric-dicitrate binding protein FerR (iron transport regulator)
MQVEALGTAFNIKAYKEDTEVVATLFEGSVQTSVKNKTVKLVPEQYASFNRENFRLTVSRAENAAYASMWRENELAFERNTMEEIAVMLNRMYNVEIVFQSEKIKKYYFSGVIKNNSLDNVIEIISLTAPIVYKSVGDTIVLNEKQEPSKNTQPMR